MRPKDVSLAIGIPHTPWVPERVENLEAIWPCLPDDDETPIRVFSEREPNQTWWERMAIWFLEETDRSHLLSVQDDMAVTTDFEEIVLEMIAAVPDKLIGLHSVHPLARAIMRDGRRWFRTRAWLVGGAYVFPRKLLVRYLEWRKENPDRVAMTSEDSLINEWATSAGEDVWHPTPTPVSHLVSFRSTYNNEKHENRQTVASALIEDVQRPKSWKPEKDVPILLMPHQTAEMERRGDQSRRPPRAVTVRVNEIELLAPEAEAQSFAAIFQRGYYDFHPPAELPPVRYVLDFDADSDVGAFLVFAHLKWGGTWSIAVTKDPVRTKFLRANVPDGTLFSGGVTEINPKQDIDVVRTKTVSAGLVDWIAKARVVYLGTRAPDIEVFMRGKGFSIVKGVWNGPSGLDVWVRTN